MRSYKWLTPDGEMISATIKEFSQLTGLRPSNCRSLACGHFLSLSGYSAVHPKTRKRRKRMQLELLNTQTKERVRLRGNVARFSSERHLCKSELHKLVCGRKIAIRDWMLASTFDLVAQVPIADKLEENS